jgi:hypothetical protein
MPETSRNNRVVKDFHFLPVSAVGAGITHAYFEPHSSQPLNFRWISVLTEIVGQAVDNHVQAWGSNLAEDSVSRENTSYGSIRFRQEARYYQNLKWVQECQVEHESDTGVVQRPFGIYCEETGGRTDIILQTDTLQLGTTGVGFSDTVGWCLFDYAAAKMTTAMNADHFRTGANTMHRIGQDGNNNLYITWNYNATAGNASASIGTWSLQSLLIDAGTLNLNTGNNGGIVTGSGTFTFGGVGLLSSTTSSTVPRLQFTGDTDTGIGRSGADTLVLIAGGQTRISASSSGATVTGNVSATGALDGNIFGEAMLAATTFGRN